MTTLGKYELHEQLGRGGFGTVYRAVDTTLGREVALKVLHPQLTTDPDFLERFRNEARLVASLDSPNIVTIYDLGEVDGRVFIAMKYLSGGSLKERLEKEGAIPFDEVLKIVQQICAGLSVAHKKGLVHRDIKPGNILFDSEGRAVLGDFGLARAIQLSSASATSSTGGVGTPAYRAPELWRGKPPVSAATDIYSLGCVLSEMLSGKVLFNGNTPDEILAQHLIDGPSLPQSFPAGVPQGIKSVIEKATARDPGDRYQTVAEFEKALAEMNLKPEPAMTQTVGPVTVPTDHKGANEVCSKPNLSNLWLGIGGAVLIGALIIVFVLANRTAAISAAVDVATSTDRPVVTQTATSTELPFVVQVSTSTELPTTMSTPEIIATPTLGIGSFKISSKDGMKLMYVPAGDFLMGSLDGVGDDNEHPQHTVYLDAYWIDQTEVTNAMYEKCVADGGCTPPSSNGSTTRISYYGNSTYDDYPVIYMNWDQADAYCQWADRTLPTEAQWEKAARGKDGQTYPWGNQSPDASLVNYEGSETTAVGSYPAGASPYGALDMAGNVWEWVADWYDSSYYQVSQSSNPTSPATGNVRVLRGGSWGSNWYIIRAAFRGGDDPSITIDFLDGFRCSLNENVSP